MKAPLFLLLFVFIGFSSLMIFWFWKNFKRTKEDKLLIIEKPSEGKQIINGLKMAAILVIALTFFVLLVVVFFGLYIPGSWRYMMGQ